MRTKTPPSVVNVPSGVSAAQSYGIDTFSLAEMQKRLPRATYEAIQATIRSGEALDTSYADAIADAMREWAVERGATHFTHWFQPLTGATAEKHDAFLSLSGGRAIDRFTGSQLIQAEPDASSFPSGGIRSTFEARGYTAWDPTSPAFLVYNDLGATLTIPSVFVSYTGEALDQKTPMLRSMRELSRAATRVLSQMGRNVGSVASTLGWEQEYFLIKREFYEGRPDLEVSGRTVLGNSPPKGQQLEDNYFGSVDDTALTFMGEVESVAWKLGIPLKTRHNEVAPHQYEAAPIYQALNVAADQNQLLMEIMRRVARRQDLAVLFHEKPFAGVNGSGKHNNWSLQDDTGRNLLDPGTSPHQNIEFLLFLTAVVRGVHKRAELLRASIASVGNDHRLGANEAPPAIISVFLGSRINDIMDMLLAGEEAPEEVEEFVKTGLAVLPDVRKDNTDRNRTSPFAFTGNKFEFRAVGSNQSNAMPMTILNLAVTEALDHMSRLLDARLAKGEDLTPAVLAVVHEVYAESKNIVFNGNNYGDAWVEEAAKRGLANEPTTPGALEAYADGQNQALFQHYNVLQPREVQARYTICLERYNRMLEIEAVQMLRMVKTGALPAAYHQQAVMANAYDKVKECGVDVSSDQKSELTAYTNLIGETIQALNGLRAALRSSPHHEDAAAFAQHGARVIVPAMEALRACADTIERRTDEDLWPYANYHAMLFQ